MTKEEFIKKHGMKQLTEQDGILIDITYATKNNFTHQKIYKEPICMLKTGTADKLLKVNKYLNKLGFKIKIWDAFRPIDAQQKLWNIYPDERFVSNPSKSMCNHCKGSAVDVTLCTMDGNELKMPTKFDCFGIKTYRNYSNILNQDIKDNVLMLEKAMIKYGFKPYYFEWWHFDDVNDYEIIRDKIW